MHSIENFGKKKWFWLSNEIFLWSRLSSFKCWLMNYFLQELQTWIKVHCIPFTDLWLSIQITGEVQCKQKEAFLHIVVKHKTPSRRPLWQLRVFKNQLNKSIKESLNCTILIALIWYSKSVKEKLLEIDRRVLERNNIMHFAVLCSSQGFG